MPDTPIPITRPCATHGYACDYDTCPDVEGRGLSVVSRCNGFREDVERPCTGSLWAAPGDRTARCDTCNGQVGMGVLPDHWPRKSGRVQAVGWDEVKRKRLQEAADRACASGSHDRMGDGDPCRHCGETGRARTLGPTTDEKIEQARRERDTGRVSSREPTGWWRAVGPDGKVWCESSSESEVRQSRRDTDTIQRHMRHVEERWEDA